MMAAAVRAVPWTPPRRKNPVRRDLRGHACSQLPALTLALSLVPAYSRATRDRYPFRHP